MRAFLVDTVARVVFFTGIAACSELVIAGMTPGQVLAARRIMVPVMALTGRPYGLWRDWVMSRLAPSGRLASVLSETATFISFQGPVSVLTLILAGASLREILLATSPAMVLMVFVGRPFGLCLDLVRRVFRTSRGRDAHTGP
ncbi:MAG: L-alanine exporter AlaE [Pseudomonadota bacterium]